MSRTLYGLSQSAWTERARWALDHHGVVFGYHEHVPMLGEVLLRMKARTTRASVPLLADGDEVVMGSVEIARYAERVGRGASLFPRDQDAEITRWVDAGERILGVGRAWFMKRFLANKGAQTEVLPTFVPGGVRGALAPSAAMAVRFLMKKYDVPDDVEARIEHTVRPIFHDVRAALSKGAYLLSPASFSAADIVMASALHVIRPHVSAKLGPFTREAWTNEALVRDFGDLLEWRDTIYDKHR